jgi:hypothetical protein
MSEPSETDALTAIVKALHPLSPDQRKRAVRAAMLFLQEDSPGPKETYTDSAAKESVDNEVNLPPESVSWLRKNKLTIDDLLQVFHFQKDGTFEILDAPGKSKKEQTIHTYILTGLGCFLAKRVREFDDELARKFCSRVGCYDRPNHSTYLKEGKGSNLSGDKSKGYTITSPGLNKSVELVRQVAGNQR